MGALSIPFAAFVAASAIGLALLGAAYLWRLLQVAVAYSLAVRGL